MNNDIFSAWLDDNPLALYQSSVPKSTTPFADYWRSQYSDVYSDFMGQLGKMALAGQTPNMTFSDYLSTYPFFDRYLSLSPRQRGEYQSGSFHWRV